MKNIEGHFWFPFRPESSRHNSRASRSRARRVAIFEPQRDIVCMEQKSVEAATFQMLFLPPHPPQKMKLPPPKLKFHDLNPRR